jgi:hypothetical protein
MARREQELAANAAAKAHEEAVAIAAAKKKAEAEKQAQAELAASLPPVELKDKSIVDASKPALRKTSEAIDLLGNTEILFSSEYDDKSYRHVNACDGDENTEWTLKGTLGSIEVKLKKPVLAGGLVVVNRKRAAEKIGAIVFANEREMGVIRLKQAESARFVFAQPAMLHRIRIQIDAGDYNAGLSEIFILKETVATAAATRAVPMQTIQLKDKVILTSAQGSQIKPNEVYDLKDKTEIDFSTEFDNQTWRHGHVCDGDENTEWAMRGAVGSIDLTIEEPVLARGIVLVNRRKGQEKLGALVYANECELGSIRLQTSESARMLFVKPTMLKRIRVQVETGDGNSGLSEIYVLK